MGLGKMFGRKSVPDELPSLAFDDVNRGGIQPPKVQSASQFKTLPKLPPVRSASPSSSAPTHQHAHAQSQGSPVEDEPGYFKELVKSVTTETKDLDKLETWYKNKFLPGDMVFQMREYWQKQQPELLLKNVSGDLKNRLMEKTNHLHSLEKEWQDIYFQLMSKEEEIRKEEKELKGSLSEFIELFRKSGRQNTSDDMIDSSKHST